MHVKAVAAAGLFALVASALAAQPPQRPPTFKTGAELVRLDVSVIDRKGEPVTSLTAEDFEIEEDGVPQKVQSFQLVDLQAHEPEGLPREGPVQPFELARDDVRVFLVFWDEYHIPPRIPAQMLRVALTNFLRTMVGPADLVAVMDPWTPMSHLRFTRDMPTLLFDVSRLQGREGVLTPARNGAEENHMREGRISLRRAEVAVTALTSAMVHMASLRDGRTVVLYLGREFQPGQDRHESVRRTAELIQTANDCNIAFYTMNPDGLTLMRSRVGVLGDLARSAGGEALTINDLNVAFMRAVRQTSAHYLVGYSPDPLRHDGKFHKVNVRVKRGGVHVRARNGYWAPSAGAKAAAKAAAAAAVVPAPIETVFGELARLGRGADSAEALKTVVEPDVPLTTIGVEMPSVWVVQRPADLRAVMSDTPPQPATTRVFRRTERLIVRVRTSGTAAEGAVVTAALIDRRGTRLVELPLRRERDNWLLDLPLASIARGDYALAVSAQAGADRSTAYVPIQVRP